GFPSLALRASVSAMNVVATPNHFADRLIAAVRAKGNPVVVGLDPRPDGLPASVLESATKCRAEHDDLPPGAEFAGAYYQFCWGGIGVVARLVPAVKPQAAFFEQLGYSGYMVLESIIWRGAKQGLIVILDGKRNDIGSTAQGYAEGYL